LGILHGLATSENAGDVVEIMVWWNSIRQRIRNGKQIPQQKLHPEEMSVSNFFQKVLFLLEKCIPNYQGIC